jgi:hypothetical protein
MIVRICVGPGNELLPGTVEIGKCSFPTTTARPGPGSSIIIGIKVLNGETIGYTILEIVGNLDWSCATPNPAIAARSLVSFTWNIRNMTQETERCRKAEVCPGPEVCSIRGLGFNQSLDSLSMNEPGISRHNGMRFLDGFYWTVVVPKIIVDCILINEVDFINTISR